MADTKKTEGEFPENSSQKPDAYSTTGDGHPPRAGERSTQENMAGQGLGQTQGAGQQEMGRSAGAGTKTSGKK